MFTLSTVISGKFLQPVCIVFVLGMLFYDGGASGALRAESWHGYVMKVRDGDSIQVKKGGKLIEIRLYGIDAPEYGQAYSKQAKRLTRSMALKKTVTVIPKDVDKYGRVVALIKSHGGMINSELVKNGLAWVYPKYCTDTAICPQLIRLEKKARKKRRGLWRQDDPSPPWRWRHKKKTY